MLLLEGYISNFTRARYYYLRVEFMSTNLSLDKLYLPNVLYVLYAIHCGNLNKPFLSTYP
jgi:hypothetical protein